MYTNNDECLKVERYIDDDLARNIGDIRSTSGYFMFVSGKLVSWRSKIYNVVSRLSAEAEYQGKAVGV